MALRWKKNPLPTGLRRVVCPQGSTLRDGAIEYAHTGTFTRTDERKGWYWVARNDEKGVPLENTCKAPVPDEATAKANALAYVRKCLKEAGAAADQGGA